MDFLEEVIKELREKDDIFEKERNVTRDQFLSEKLNTPINQSFFSSWDGFGKLVTAMQSGKIPSTLYKIGDCIISACPFDNCFPDRFADAVAKYLGWKK